MSTQVSDELEAITLVLDLQIRKLDEQGLTFAASLLRITKLDLQMRIHGISEEEIDVLSFALHIINQTKTAQSGRSPDPAKLDETGNK